MKLPELRFGSGNTQLLLSIAASEAAASLASNADSSGRTITRDTAISTSSVALYINAAIAENTRRAYQQDLRDFLKWGGVVPCSPEKLAAYIAERAEVSSAHTITRRVVGIGRAHVSQGYPDPAKTDLVRTVLRGVRRVKGLAQRQVSPLLKADVLAIAAQTQGIKGLRDRALILLGFAAALRRSELAALDFGDIEFVREGLLVHLRKSKTDQIGEGRKIGVPWGRTSACPVKAVENWLQSAQIESGPVFRPVNRVGRFCAINCTHSRLHSSSDYAKRVGLNPDNISGHSLRSGLLLARFKPE